MGKAATHIFGASQPNPKKQNKQKLAMDVETLKGLQHSLLTAGGFMPIEEMTVEDMRFIALHTSVGSLGITSHEKKDISYRDPKGNITRDTRLIAEAKLAEFYERLFINDNNHYIHDIISRTDGISIYTAQQTRQMHMRPHLEQHRATFYLEPTHDAHP